MNIVNSKTNYSVILDQRWKKLTKQHWQNFEPEQLAHKICGGNAQNRVKKSKNAKNCTKRQKMRDKNV